MSERKLSALERTFVACMQMLSEMTQGHTVGFLEELVHQHGISGFFKWAEGTNRCWTVLAERYGERDAHLLAWYASMGNGCQYCAQGHLFAHNLHFFQDRGGLYPLAEDEVGAMMTRPDGALLEELRQRLSAPEHATGLRLVERLHALRSGGPVAADAEDPYLRQALGLYEWVNECSIVATAEAPPLGPIARQKVLRTRYAQARRLQRENAAPAATG